MGSLIEHHVCEPAAMNQSENKLKLLKPAP